jgi:potassium efflux system protein
MRNGSPMTARENDGGDIPPAPLRRATCRYVAVLVCFLAMACVRTSWSAETQSPTTVVPQVEALSPTTIGIEAGTLLNRIWEYELYKDAAKGYSLTVQAVCEAVVVLLLGAFLSWRIARWVGRKGLVRAGVEEGLASSIEKVVYYGLLVLVVLMALRVVDVRLTSLAVFGGFLAVGVGFGAKSVINDFISGLILMIERPIRVKDIIEVDGQQGRVVSIGPRCSHVRLLDGTDVLAPNSKFLENKVINYTLSSTTLRLAVKITASNDVGIHEAKRLLLKAVEEHDSILTEPKPGVLCSDLGDKAAVLEVFFWIDSDTSPDGRLVCSDVRFRVEELLRTAAMGGASPESTRPREAGPPPDADGAGRI